jgi:cytochrome c1
MTLALNAGLLMADEAQRGKRAAERLCSPCHVVASEAPAGRTAPTFTLVANVIPLSETYLDVWLRNPNPPMHRFQLTSSMVSDLLAYMRSLRK